MIFNAYNISFIIAKLFNLYIIKRYMSIFFNSKKGNKLITILLYSLYFFISCSTYIFFDIPFINVLINLIFIISISLYHGKGFKKQLWCGFLIFIVLLLVEIGVTAFIISPYLNWFDSYNCTNVSGIFINQIIQFLVVLIIENIATFRSKGEVPVVFLAASLTVPTTSAALLIFVTGIKNVTQRDVLVMLTIIFFLNTLVFVIYDSFSIMYEQNLNSAILNQERQLYYNQCLLMKETAEDIRDFRHDMNNHLMMLNELIDYNKTHEAKEYIKSLSKQTLVLQNAYSCTGNIVVDSILNYKLNSFHNKDIKIVVETNIPTDIPIEMIDLSTILTNLIDNSIQALEKVEDRKLLINLNYNKGVLCIIVKNSYNGIINYENGEIITTKSESGHGRGIKIITKTIDKYDGLMNLSHDDDFFIVEILLYGKKS